MDAQKRYMKSDPKHVLSMSRATLGLPMSPAPAVRIEGVSAGVPPHRAEGVRDVRIEGESAGVPQRTAEGGILPEVVGVPLGAFTWSCREVERLFVASSRRRLLRARHRSWRASVNVCAIAYLPIWHWFRCIAWRCKCPSLSRLGQNSRKLVVFWHAGGSTR